MAVLALLLVGVALGYLVQGAYSGPLSHYALVKALAGGTASIDETRFQTGTETTVDHIYRNGHYYSDKAPGLAFVTLPAYLALEALGVRTSGDPALMLWALGIVGVLLPAVLLLFLIRSVCDHILPGVGAWVAVVTGLGTLLTTFATMFFPHALSALLVFGAFALLFLNRCKGSRLIVPAAAGIALGYAVTTEYSNALAVPVLAVYSVVPFANRLRRGIALAAGFLVGVAPLVLYNQFAFGAVTHLSYENEGKVRSGQELISGDASERFDAPRLATAVDLLLGKWGLVTTAPVLACGIAGLVLLYRQGWRAEAVVASVLGFLFLTYVAAYYDPFGSVPPGPRLLIQVIPFLGISGAVAFRRAPLPTAVLASCSVAVTLALTVSRPFEAWDGNVLGRLTSRNLEAYSQTIVDQVATVGWYRLLPLFLAACAALACAAITSHVNLRTDLRGFVGAAVALVTWAAIATQSHRLLRLDGYAKEFAALGIALLVGGVVFIVARLVRHESDP